MSGRRLADYQKAVDAMYETRDAFTAAVASARSKGLKVMLDLGPITEERLKAVFGSRAVVDKRTSAVDLFAARSFG